MLLFFLFLILLVIIILALLSDIKLIISNLELIIEENEKRLKFKGKIGIYFLGRVKIFSIKIDSRKANKFFNISKATQRLKELYARKGKQNISIKVIKNLIKEIKLERLKFKLIIDTENVVNTAYLIGGISALIPNLVKNNIKNYKKKNYEWQIKPMFKNHNCIYLELNSIISIRLVHIINMLKVRGGEKYERTSNRRLNANCYGEH